MKPARNRKKLRLAEYDYAAPGAYFITICVYENRCCLGYVKNGVMELNPHGKIVSDQWEWLHRQYDYLILDAFVVMPNHFHAILVVGNGRDRSPHPTDRSPHPTDRSPHPTDRSPHPTDRSPHPKIKPVPQLIGAFKTTSSKLIRQSGFTDFRWQKSYYDRIVSDERALINYQQYIKTNPMRWASDP
ncbi:MAG: hypothetical protein KDH97_03435 [Calditrichaeota bacterium]|nr:hypothetical protein [Calditrichota bacterium]MCB0302293.1 hypothetical protein [Calditrichota bacterium]